MKLKSSSANRQDFKFEDSLLYIFSIVSIFHDKSRKAKSSQKDEHLNGDTIYFFAFMQ